MLFTFVHVFFFPFPNRWTAGTRISFCCYSNLDRILVNAKSIDPFLRKQITKKIEDTATLDVR